MSAVVVIGGGLVGSSAAYRLARAGAQVTLIDRADDGQATAAGAGILSPGVSFRASGDGLYALVKASADYYAEMLGQLAEDGEHETGYDEVGSLHIAVNEAEAARHAEILEQINARRADGMRNIGEVTQVDGRGARELFPALADVHSAIYVSEAARVDGRLLRDALRRGAQRHGATIRIGDAQVIRQGDRVTGVQVDQETLGADAVIIAAGAWSNALAGTLGLRVPVYPQRGQIAHLLVPDADTSKWSIILGFYSHYMLTFPPNRVVAGATREHDAGYDYRLTAAGVAEVLNEALRVAPGLAPATVHEIRIGLRPASPDQLPIMGRAPGFQNVYFATGHGASGLQLGPYSGAAVADLAVGKPVSIDLDPFAVDRFQEGVES